MPLHLFRHLVHELGRVVGVVLDALDELSDEGDRRLVLHVNPVPIAQLQEVLAGRIVGRADEIDVCLAEQQHVLLQLFGCQSATRQKGHIMPVHTPELDRTAIDQKFLPVNLHLSNPEAPADLLKHAAVPHQGCLKPIQVRMFRIPQIVRSDGQVNRAVRRVLRQRPGTAAARHGRAR